jgi:hypothetical protein
MSCSYNVTTFRSSAHFSKMLTLTFIIKSSDYILP